MKKHKIINKLATMLEFYLFLNGLQKLLLMLSALLNKFMMMVIASIVGCLKNLIDLFRLSWCGLVHTGHETTEHTVAQAGFYQDPFVYNWVLNNHVIDYIGIYDDRPVPRGYVHWDERDWLFADADDHEDDDSWSESDIDMEFVPYDDTSSDTDEDYEDDVDHTWAQGGLEDNRSKTNVWVWLFGWILKLCLSPYWVRMLLVLIISWWLSVYMFTITVVMIFCVEIFSQDVQRYMVGTFKERMMRALLSRIDLVSFMIKVQSWRVLYRESALVMITDVMLYMKEKYSVDLISILGFNISRLAEMLVQKAEAQGFLFFDTVKTLWHNMFFSEEENPDGLRRMNLRLDNLFKSFDFLRRLGQICAFCYNFVLAYVFNVKDPLWCSVEEFVCKYQKLCSKSLQEYEREDCVMFRKALNEGRLLKADLLRTKVSFSVSVFLSMVRFFEEHQVEINDRLAAYDPRILPVSIMLWGPAGTGKTVLYEAIVSHYSRILSPLHVVDQSIVYRFKPDHNGRLEGMNERHVIVACNDVAMFSNEETNAPIWATLCNLMDTQPFRPEQSAIGNKCTFVKPQVVVCTSNTVLHDGAKPGIRDVQAILRRFDIIVHMTLKEGASFTRDVRGFSVQPTLEELDEKCDIVQTHKRGFKTDVPLNVRGLFKDLDYALNLRKDQFNNMGGLDQINEEYLSTDVVTPDVENVEAQNFYTGVHEPVRHTNDFVFQPVHFAGVWPHLYLAEWLPDETQRTISLMKFTVLDHRPAIRWLGDGHSWNWLYIPMVGRSNMAVTQFSYDFNRKIAALDLETPTRIKVWFTRMLDMFGETQLEQLSWGAWAILISLFLPWASGFGAFGAYIYFWFYYTAWGMTGIFTPFTWLVFVLLTIVFVIVTAPLTRSIEGEQKLALESDQALAETHEKDKKRFVVRQVVVEPSVVAETGEKDKKRHIVRHRVVEPEPDKVRAEIMIDAQSESVSQVVRLSSVAFVWYHIGSKRFGTGATCVALDWYVLPSHALAYVENDRMVHFMRSGQVKVFDLGNLEIKRFDREVDLMLVRFTGCFGRGVYKYMPNRGSLFEPHEGHFVSVRVENGVLVPTLRYFDKVVKRDTLVESHTGSLVEGTYRVVGRTRGYYTVNVETKAGDCGLPYICYNTNHHCGLFHFGSSAPGVATAALLYQEDIASLITLSQLDLSEDTQAQGVCWETNNSWNAEVCQEFEGVHLLQVLSKQDSAFVPVRSTIKPSILQEYDQVPISVPSQLGSYWYNGQKVMQGECFFKSLDVESYAVSPHLLRDAAKVLACNMALADRKNSVLSMMEAINGYGVMKAIVIDTSAGFKYRHVVSKGKYPLLARDVDGVLRPNTQLEQDVLALENLCKGCVPLVVYCDVGKDERYDLDNIVKTYRGKTMLKYRVVSSMSLDLVILCRMYFGAWITAMKQNHPYGHCMVGVNPLGFEWHLLFKYMTGRARYDTSENSFIELDQKKNDLVHPYEVLYYGVFQVINQWYLDNFGPPSYEEDCIRRNLYVGMLANIHVYRNLVYTRHMGLPSGCAMTTELNSCGTELMNMVSFQTLCIENNIPTTQVWNEWGKVRAVYYGDDSLLFVPGHLSFFNQVTLTGKMWDLFHMSCTVRGATATEKFSKSNEVYFLQRRFHLHKDMNLVVGLKDLSDCVEIANWYRINPLGVIEATRVNFEASLRELFFHGEVVFNKYRALYNRALKEHGMPEITMLYSDLLCGYLEDLA